MTFNIEYAALSDRGRVREENQDNWGAYPGDGLYIVSDGLGGEFAGALAAKIVVEVLPLLLRQHMAEIQDLGDRRAAKSIKLALSELSRQVSEQTSGEPGLEGMGATVVLLLIRNGKALVAHMGDSRAYRLRRGRLSLLTKDHSIVQMLLDRGEISREELGVHPARGQVTRSVGMDGEPLPNVRRVDVRQDDRFMLCTDGLTGMLGDGDICQILKSTSDPRLSAQQLINAANGAGGKDNITALVLQINHTGKTSASPKRSHCSTQDR